MAEKKKGGTIVAIVILAICIVLGLGACVFLWITQKTDKLNPNSNQVSVAATELIPDEAAREEAQLELESFSIGTEPVIEQETETETETESEQEAEEEISEEESEYLCSYSAERIMTEEDIAELQAGEYEGLPKDKTIIQMVINEMYARYGYQFTTEKIQEYFNEKTWYMEIPERTMDMDSVYQQMSDIEKANIELLSSIEE